MMLHRVINMLLKELLKVLDPLVKLSITIDGDNDGDVCYEGSVMGVMVAWYDVTWDTYRRVISLSYDKTTDTYQVMLAS